MSRKETSRHAPGRLALLLASGAHGAAGREARATLASPDASAPDRAAAAVALASLAPEPWAAAVGAMAAALAAGVGAWTLLRGGR